MKTIYIVYGGAGWYEDYHEWNIKAFISKEKAKQLVESLNNEAERVYEHNRKVYEKHLFPKIDRNFEKEERREEIKRIRKLIESKIIKNKYDLNATTYEQLEYDIKELELDEMLCVEIVEN